MMGRRAVVLGSEEAARVFYDESVVERSGAVPVALKNLLFGRGAVHGLDGEAHRRRKALMRQLVGDGSDLGAEVARRLEVAVSGWEGRDIDVFDELVHAYGGAALAWVGCEPSASEEEWMARALSLIVDGFGGAGSAYLRAWAARWRTQLWLRGRIARARRRQARAPAGSPLEVLADRRDLSRSVAAVELGNLVRPTVAVAWLGSFATWRLAQDKEWRGLLATDQVGAAHVAFAHEVRRTSPFVPVLAGRARRSTTVDGVPIRAGDRLVLDVWGIDTAAERWAGYDFNPDRFWQREPGAYEMVPQGGGEPGGHRCPGEDPTIRIVAETARVLARGEWSLSAPADLDMTRIPTRPAGGPRLHWIRSRSGSPAPSPHPR
jgi:fatty-acid peroxygenase